jgi:hypothetical protein
MTDLEALVVAAYVFADEYSVPARPGRPAKVSDAELVALAVCQAAIGIGSDRRFLGLAGRVLPGWFPPLPDQSQDNRRLRGLVGLISLGQQHLARWLDGGRVRLADGTQLALASYPGCEQRSHFAGFARYGYSKSHHRFLWGVRLVLLTDERGLPLGYTLVPANPRPHAHRRQPRTGARASLTPARNQSVLANLKDQMRLERHLAKTPARLAVRIAQPILALTLGILLNTLAGRPARALAAYDGR